MSNLLSFTLKPCFEWLATLSSANLKVALTVCQTCQKPASYNLLQTIRHQHTKQIEPEDNYKSPSSNISLEQGVKLSRQGCSQGYSKTTAPASTAQTGAPPGRKRAKVRDVPGKDWILPEGYNTGIKIYNTLTRQKEPLILPQAKTATWYDIYYLLLIIWFINSSWGHEGGVCNTSHFLYHM